MSNWPQSENPFGSQYSPAPLPAKKKLNSTFIILLASGIATVLIFGIGGFIFFNKSLQITNTIKSVETYIAADQLESARQLLDKDKVKTSSNPELSNLSTKVNNLIQSKKFFSMGEDALASENFVSAIDYFSKVRSDDNKRFAEAKTKIVSARSSYTRILLNEVTTLQAKKKYIAAYEKLQSASSTYLSDDPQLKELESFLAPLAAQQEADIAAKREAKLKAALKSMRKSRDKFREITFYEDRSTPYYADNKAFYLYAGVQDGGSPFLWLRIRYSADDWLFVNSVQVSVDGEVYRFSTSYSDWKRDNAYGAVWEWVDISPEESDLNILRAIIKSKSAIVRYEGEDYYSDKTISKQEKRALRNVLNAYEALQEGIS